VLVYELTQEDIALKLEARVNSEGEGISGGDTARHGGNGNSGERKVRIREREYKEGYKEGCNSGEKGFRSSVKETLFFPFPFFPSAAIARVFGAIVGFFYLLYGVEEGGAVHAYNKPLDVFECVANDIGS